ncbi:MAG: thiol peroxidase [Polyangiaceae bacterium]|nr:thiol peroxidase [Polyangiaceae bacterium]
MAKTAFKGQEVNTSGELPSIGSGAPPFTLVGADLSEKTLADYQGKKIVLTINPSYDTGVCQATARRFHQELGARGDTVVLMVSADLPFAQKRFCEAEGIVNIFPLSSFRSSFAQDYGVELVDGPLRGLTARAVVVLDDAHQVVYSELTKDIVEEPNFEAAAAALSA